MSDDRVKRELERITRQLRVTKIVATRAIKGNTGENFAGFSAKMKPTFKAASQSSDDVSDLVFEDGVEESREAVFDGDGLTLQDARLSFYVLAMYVDISVIDAAWASGSITPEYRADLTKATRARYVKLMARFIQNGEVEDG